MLQFGVLTAPEFGVGSPYANGLRSSNGVKTAFSYQHPQELTSTLDTALPLEDPVVSTCMPEAWVRAAILIRINSLVHGHSAVRPAVVEMLLALLEKDIIPCVPLHGSISASGDLSPLSYIGGVIQGGPNLKVWAGDRQPHHRYITTADRALAEACVEPLKLAAKEGLAIVNGTAFSAAVGTLAMHEAHGLAVLSQILTAMGVEALCGTTESFDPFFAKVRPHPGQVSTRLPVVSTTAAHRH